MDEVAQVELAGALGAGQLHPQLPVAVVEHQLVVAAAAEFLALVAGQGCGVALAALAEFARGAAVPGGAVADPRGPFRAPHAPWNYRISRHSDCATLP